MYLEFENLVVRNATKEDAHLLGKWWRDGKVMAHAGFPLGLKIKDEEIAASLEKDTDDTRRRLILEVDEHPVGEMNWTNLGDSVVEIGIKICVESHQGKGYGTKFLKLLIDYLFTQKKFNKIVLDTNLKNIRAQHTYEKLGFIKTEVKSDSWKDQLGQLQSSVEYELERKDWLSSI